MIAITIYMETQARIDWLRLPPMRARRNADHYFERERHHFERGRRSASAPQYFMRFDIERHWPTQHSSTPPRTTAPRVCYEAAGHLKDISSLAAAAPSPYSRHAPVRNEEK